MWIPGACSSALPTSALGGGGGNLNKEQESGGEHPWGRWLRQLAAPLSAIGVRLPPLVVPMETVVQRNVKGVSSQIILLAQLTSVQFK
jgi:hypothetical protein